MVVRRMVEVDDFESEPLRVAALRAKDEHDALTKQVAELRRIVDAFTVESTGVPHLDAPSLDGTPNAHPAYWRGYAACVEEVHNANQFHPRNEAIIFDAMGDLVDFLRASIPKEPKT